MNLIGNNVIVDPSGLVKEINELQQNGIEISSGNLALSDRAHLTLAYHKKLDEAIGSGIGTTGRGIGPTITDKSARTGIRVFDLFDLNALEKKVRDNLDLVNYFLDYYDAQNCEFSEIWDELLEKREKILPFVCRDTKSLILKNKGSLLFEGAQGTMLDIDLGTYPFVTSSNPTIGGAYTGAGVYVLFDRIIGVMKSYTTRVGNGVFPTEQCNKVGERLRKRGNEFGTTTGRPRRCGWLDLFAAKYAVEVNGINEISLTKFDILDKEKNIQVCVGYFIDGRTIDYFPITKIQYCNPIYETFSGWETDTSKIKKPVDLPENARKYIECVEDFLEVPVKRVGVGPRRDQIIEF